MSDQPTVSDPGQTGLHTTSAAAPPAPPAEESRVSSTARVDVGRYEVFEQVGQGGMGTVLRGRDPELDRELAIKTLRVEHRASAGLARRFLEEARIGGQLQHPGVVPVHELGTADGLPYFTMKLVRGRTLAELLQERSSPADGLPRLLQVFEQVCQTVAYAHSRGILHRDLKPDNIMVGAFGEVQVMDWGLAKVLDRPGEEGTVHPASDVRLQTQAGTVAGTPAYMAPEQARGEVGQLDARADVFGLGAILCAILTGRPPFLG